MTDVYWKRNVSLTFNNHANLGYMDGLRLRFYIEKTLSGMANKCVVHVFNPNQDSQNILDLEGSTMTLSAGYQENSKLRFLGDILRTRLIKKDSNRILEIFAADGASALAEAYMNDAIQANASRSIFLERALKSLKGITRGQFLENADVGRFVRGSVFSGPTPFLLNNYTRSFGLNWMILNHQLYVLDAHSTLREEEVILNLARDLKQAPTPTKAGVRFTSVLGPKIEPGSRISFSKFEAPSLQRLGEDLDVFSGAFKAVAVRMHGSTYEDVWQSQVSCVYAK